jgi:DNA-binding response OmpR family regulator
MSDDVRYLQQTGLVSESWQVRSQWLADYVVKQVGGGGELLVVHVESGEIWLQGKRIDDQLSANEYRFLRYMYEHRDRVVERDEIAEQVWGGEEGVSDEAIDQLVRRVREKIEPDRRQPQYLLTIRGRGFQLKLE